MNDKGLPRDPENADFVKWFSPDEKEDYKKVRGRVANVFLILLICSSLMSMASLL